MNTLIYLGPTCFIKYIYVIYNFITVTINPEFSPVKFWKVVSVNFNTIFFSRKCFYFTIKT